MSLRPGRWAARPDGALVVFIIGMRINRPWKVRQWWPVFSAMGPMIAWQRRHPVAGVLGTEFAFRSPLAPMLVQYWRSFEDLERFARDPDAPHLEPWKRFNATVRDSGDVGIWHETYRIAPGNSEAVFVNMPPSGLGAAGRLEPVGTTAATAAQRIGDRRADEPPVAGY